MADTSTPYNKPLPKTRAVDEPYWEGTRAGELRLQHCLDCGTWWHPPSEYCPGCLGEHYEWRAAAGTGRIWSRIFMHQVYFAGFKEDVPYNVVWVELDEGPMITASVTGASHDEIEVDRRVAVTFDAVTDELTLPRFRLL